MADNNLYGIIGVGRFGLALAEKLLDDGKTIIAIDKDQNKLYPLRTRVNQLIHMGELSKDSLIEAGIQDCGCVVVCIGKDVEANILATLNAIELGVPRVIAKAISNDHSRILEKIGANVVNPEVDMGVKLAKTLTTNLTLDILPIGEDFSIIEVEINNKFANKTIQDLHFRNKFGINIVAIVRDDKANGNILPDTVIKEGDLLVISGNNHDIRQFELENSK